MCVSRVFENLWMVKDLEQSKDGNPPGNISIQGNVHSCEEGASLIFLPWLNTPSDILQQKTDVIIDESETTIGHLTGFLQIGV